MRRFWNAVFAFILLFWHLIERVLTKLEHADFVVEHMPWLARAMQAVREALEVPEVVTVYLIPIAGLALLGWVFWPQVRQRIRPKPDHDASVPPQKPSAISHSADLSPAPVSGSIWMTPHEVITYLAEGSGWGAKINEDHPNAGYYSRLMAFTEFRRVAGNGELRIVGRLHGSHEEIPSTYWLSASLEVFSALDDKPNQKTEAGDLGIAQYSDVKIRREDVYRAWPRATTATPATVRKTPVGRPPSSALNSVLMPRRPDDELRASRACAVCLYADYGQFGLDQNPVCVRAPDDVHGRWHTCHDTRANRDWCNHGEWFEARESNNP